MTDGDKLMALAFGVVLAGALYWAGTAIRADYQRDQADKQRTRVQARRCPDRSPKLCPSAHFCPHCRRHW